MGVLCGCLRGGFPGEGGRGVPALRPPPKTVERFVELVVKNPLCPPRQPVQSELFRSRLDAFVRSLPFFAPRAA